MGQCFGAVRGGHRISVTLVRMLLVANTGIVGATVVTMGLLSLPTMLQTRYGPKLARRTICVAGTLGRSFRRLSYWFCWEIICRKSIQESFHLSFYYSLHLTLLPFPQVLQLGCPKLYSVSCSCHYILTKFTAAPITRVIGADSWHSEYLSNSLSSINSKIICLFVTFVCIY